MRNVGGHLSCFNFLKKRKSDFIRIFACQTYPALFIDVTEDATEVRKFWDDKLVFESLRYKLEVSFDSPGERGKYLVNGGIFGEL